MPEKVNRGENRPQATLTPALVLEMKADKAGGMSYRKMAAKYGVGYGAAYRAANGLSWKHVV